MGYLPGSSPGSDEDGAPIFARMLAIEREIAATPAADLRGIAIKARIVDHWLRDVGMPSDYRGAHLAAGLIADAERLAG